MFFDVFFFVICVEDFAVMTVFFIIAHAAITSFYIAFVNDLIKVTVTRETRLKKSEDTFFHQCWK